MVTLKNVAAATGLSINTVSRALRNSGYVSDAARTAALAAARELGYAPSRAARELRNRRSEFIAIVAESGDELHIGKITAAAALLEPAGYRTNVLFVADAARAENLGRNLRSLAPAGIILIGVGAGLIDLARELAAEFPVAINAYDRVAGLDCVYGDRRGGAAAAVRHLYARGRRRIVYVGDDPGGFKFQGYEAAVRELGITGMHLAAPDGDVATVRAAARQLAGVLAARQPRPDAIQTIDLYAAALLAELGQYGIRVPEDIAIVGFDDRSIARLTAPELTTVRQPNAEVGAALAELLGERIATPALPPRARCLPMELVVRKSS